MMLPILIRGRRKKTSSAVEIWISVQVIGIPPNARWGKPGAPDQTPTASRRVQLPVKSHDQSNRRAQIVTCGMQNLITSDTQIK